MLEDDRKRFNLSSIKKPKKSKNKKGKKSKKAEKKRISTDTSEWASSVDDVSLSFYSNFFNSYFCKN